MKNKTNTYQKRQDESTFMSPLQNFSVLKRLFLKESYFELCFPDGISQECCNAVTTCFVNTSAASLVKKQYLQIAVDFLIARNAIGLDLVRELQLNDLVEL